MSLTEEERTDLLAPLLEALDRHAVAITAIAQSNHEEQNGMVAECINRCGELGARLTEVMARLSAVEATTGAQNTRLGGHDRMLSDHRAEALRRVDETKAELTTMVGQAFEATRSGVAKVDVSVIALRGDLTELKSDIGGEVLRALTQHVERIESAATTLTRSPRVKTAASIAGTFAGGATVSVLLEILRHFHW